MEVKELRFLVSWGESSQVDMGSWWSVSVCTVMQSLAMPVIFERQTHRQTREKVRGQCHILVLRWQPSCFCCDRVLTTLGICLVDQAGWPGSPRDPPDSISETQVLWAPSSLVWLLETESDSHVCVTRALHLSHRPRLLLIELVVSMVSLAVHKEDLSKCLPGTFV